MIKLTNTLTKKKENFVPQNKDKVSMYVCGPTVYDRAHIGNARAVVIFDMLYRLLMAEFGKDKVVYARNITDVDDKINKAAKERNISISELTEETIKMFHDDMGSLNCIKPNIEPKATEHIKQMQNMIKTLINNSNAYEAKGHVLFDVTSYKKYGLLSGRSLDEMIAGARVEVAPYKKNPADFVLWKPSNDDEPGWGSPWGYGRPGWHIECSAMSTEYLGETFDIHGGGADLQFPHHENEIAQSCCSYKDSEFARIWVHNGFLTVNGEKMSKSLGNFVTVHHLVDNEKINGEVIRYALLATHYKKPLDWTEKSIDDAKKALDNFYKILSEDDGKKGDINPDFIKALEDDLNTPLAMSVLHGLLSKIKSAEGERKSKLINEFRASGELLGIFRYSAEQWFETDIDENLQNEIEGLIEKRNLARKNKDWAEADNIRNLLLEKKVVLSDNNDGTTSWSYR